MNQRRAVHVATITKHHDGKTYVTHLLRHSYREGGKVKHLTLGNLSDLPEDLICLIRRRLAGEPIPNDDDDFQIVRSLPHGHVAAVLGTLRRIGLDRILSSKPYLATLCKNRVRWESAPDVLFERLTLPTPLQRRAFDLLGLSIGS
jgi:hypothetical protein